MTTREELELAAEAMKRAGCENVKVTQVQKVPNEYNVDVYVAVVEDAMAVYTPQWKWRNNSCVQFISF